MEYNFKKYKISKIQNYFKSNDFFLIFHSSKLSFKEWIVIEQQLKKLKLKHYKVYNGTIPKTFKKSIYKNYSQMVCSLVVFIKPTFKLTDVKMVEIKKKLKSLFILLSVKMNNKIYLTSQISDMQNFAYKKNVFKFSRTIEKSIKLPYIFKRTIRNNVI